MATKQTGYSDELKKARILLRTAHVKLKRKKLVPLYILDAFWHQGFSIDRSGVQLYGRSAHRVSVNFFKSGGACVVEVYDLVDGVTIVRCVFC